MWLPGQFASFAAVPGDPGFSLETIFYVRSASATAGVDFSRGGQLARRPCPADEQYIYLTPSYTFAGPGAAGPALARRDILRRPVGCDGLGNPDGTWRSLAVERVERQRLGPQRPLPDRLPEVAAGRSQPHGLRHGQRADRTLRSRNRLTGVGLGHWAVDLGPWLHLHAGVGLRVLRHGGPYLQFRQSPDRLSKRHGRPRRRRHVLLVRRLLLRRCGRLPLQPGQPRTRAAARAWAISAREVAGVGPQAGWTFTVGGVAIDVNLRGYKEFAAQNRPEGWNAWLTLSLARALRKPGG